MKWLVPKLVFCLPLFLQITTGNAQHILRLVEYTNVWKYDQSGADLGAAWKEPSYDDSSWPEGPGLLGVETNTPPFYPVPLNTTLILGNPEIITYYFRTAFEIPELPPTLVGLSADLYVDDGCVIYLNGTEWARLLVPTNQNYQTFTTNAAPYEGYRTVIRLGPGILQAGTNILAAEVHQNVPISSDIVFGMRLSATIAEPIEIISNPSNRVVVAGQSNTFYVGVAGGPAAFQWFKDDASIPGATNQLLAQNSVQTNMSGAYRVSVSNWFGVRWSEPARLDVLPTPGTAGDFTGPRMLSATVPASSSTNFIDVIFTEVVEPASAGPSAFQIRRVEDGSLVTITNVLVNGVTARIRVGGPNWHRDGTGRYMVIANGVRDRSPNGNVIAPDSQIGVAWSPVYGSAELLPVNTEWSYHVSVLNDPSMLDALWMGPDFVENSFWRRGLAPFYTMAAGTNTCFGPGQTEIAFQIHPLCFRTTFDGSGVPSRCTLVAKYLAYDGLVVFLNGKELFRDHVTGATEDLNVDTRADPLNQSNLTPAKFLCVERSITNVPILPGTNHLACGIYQYRAGQNQTNDLGDAVFSMTLRANFTTNEPPQLPLITPILDAQLASPTLARLSWTGPGFALETTTNVSQGKASYPLGPWIEVRNMSNPYTNSLLAEPARFFRLKR